MTGQAYSDLTRRIVSDDTWEPVKGWAPEGNMDDMELHARCTAGAGAADDEARRVVSESGLTGRITIVRSGDIISFR